MTKLDLAHLAEVAVRLGRATTLSAKLSADFDFRSTFTQPTVLALLDRLREAEGALRPALAMLDEYERDEECDDVKINGFVEKIGFAARAYFNPQSQRNDS